MDIEQTVKLLAFVGSLAVFFTLERLFPYARRPLFALKHLVKNVGFVPFTVIVSRFIALPVSYFATLHPLTAGLPLPEPYLLLVHLILLDLALYVWHRLNHEIPFLWRFHEVHHRDTAMESTTALRFHFGELILSTFFRAPILMLLAVPFTHVVLFEALVGVCSFFHHSNIRLPHRAEQVLSRYLITPALHWMHHHRKQVDTDSNYGLSITLWDKMFRTYTSPARTPTMPLGVEGEKADLPFIKLLGRPFQTRKTRV